MYDATSDPDRVRALFAAARRTTGYGIACGRAPLYLVGLDLDVKHGIDSPRALRRLAAAHGFAVPATTTVLTPVRGTYRLAPGSAARAPAPVPEALLALLLPPPQGTRRPDDGWEGRRTTEARWCGSSKARRSGSAMPGCTGRPAGPTRAARGDDLAEPLIRAALSLGLPEHEARSTVASARQDGSAAARQDGSAAARRTVQRRGEARHGPRRG
ncbi:hypothetical protein [Streptomyces spirodelae]|uniref:hypothetical protein n=1 Tax=Streptomyces spirodelae TaxID=2812904 RepID=UPI0027DD1BFD|nr:hypothetical protein [Streptomyces spirodelae]